MLSLPQEKNHHNFFCNDEDTAYLEELAKQRFGGNILGANKSELFRLIIKEHRDGKCLTDKSLVLLQNLSKFYGKDKEKLLLALLSFLWNRKPDISILGL